MNKKSILALPLAFVLAFSPLESFAGGVEIMIQDAQENQETKKPESDPTSGTAAGREAERIAKRVSNEGFFSKPGLIGAAIVAATIAVALQAATDVVEGTLATTTDTTPTSTTATTTTTTTTTTATSTSTGTGN